MRSKSIFLGESKNGPLGKTINFFGRQMKKTSRHALRRLLQTKMRLWEKVCSKKCFKLEKLTDVKLRAKFEGSEWPRDGLKPLSGPPKVGVLYNFIEVKFSVRRL